MIPKTAAQMRAFTGRFAHALQNSNTEQEAAELLLLLATPLCDEGFPAFIKLLLVIEESGDYAAKEAVCAALNQLLITHQLPCGFLSAWGASLFWDQTSSPQPKTYTVAQLSSNLRRKYGPIEFLTVWYSQKTHRPYLTDEVYEKCMRTLLSLFDRDTLKANYAAHLTTELASAAIGAYSNATRQRLNRLVGGWQQGMDINSLADALLT